MLKIYFFRPLAFASELIGCLNPREKYEGSANQTAVGDACLPWSTPGLPKLFEDQG